MISFLTILTLLFLSVPPGQKQAAPARPELSTQEIIQRFAAAETQNKIARNNYTFTQDFDIKTIGMGGQVSGEYRRVSDIVYDDRGARVEKITFFPMSTLTEIGITQEDMKDLAGVQPFALTTEDIPKYQIDYVGKERVDELNTYTFNVKPKKLVEGERYFEGKIWVDDQDLQVVKAVGQAVPQVKDQAFPHFESYRENIDGKYWFPTYVYADDDLVFKKSPSVHIRMVVKYQNYKKFTTNIRVVNDGEPGNDEAGKKQGAAESDKSTAKPGEKPPKRP
jgi:hypothetical protein